MGRIIMQFKFKGSISYSVYPKKFSFFTLRSLWNNISFKIFVALFWKFAPHTNISSIKETCFSIELNHTKFLILNCVVLQKQFHIVNLILHKHYPILSLNVSLTKYIKSQIDRKYYNNTIRQDREKEKTLVQVRRPQF